MQEPLDIRDRETLSDSEIKELNFIQNSAAVQFRRYNRQGLRSHIFEILDSKALDKEHKGEIRDGYRIFPRALPRYMLRILRTKFRSVDEALSEVDKYTMLLHFLTPELLACSNEFIVDYKKLEKSEILLCGIQEYVDGTILNPWHLLDNAPLEPYFPAADSPYNEIQQTRETCRKSILKFVQHTWKMVSQAGYIPDLAGHGNLLLCKTGKIKLVDINNIIEVKKSEEILLDDKGYPSCDKSIEVLSLLMEKLLPEEKFPEYPLLNHFLDHDRREEVHRFEKQFFQAISNR